MAVNKNFVVKHGLEVNNGLIYVNADEGIVGVGTTVIGYNLHVIGGIGATDLNVTGVTSTRSLNVSEDTYIQTLFSDGINVSGTSTIGIATISSTLHVGSSGTTLTAIGNSVGISTNNPIQRFQVGLANTLGFTTTTSGLFVITSDGFVGVQTGQPGAELHVFGNQIVTGVVTTSSLNVENDAYITTISANGIGATNLSISGISTFSNTIDVNSNVDITDGLVVGSGITAQDLNVSGIGTIETLDTSNGTIDYLDGTNVTISGIGTIETLDTNVGTIDYLDGTNVNVSGVVTASSFSGALSGTANTTSNIPNLTGDIVSSNTVTSISPGVIVNSDINSSANIELSKLAQTGEFKSTTINSTNISGNSGYFNVGIITALSGTGLNYSGVSTINTLDTNVGTIDHLNSTNINSSGIVTAAFFYGSGANLTDVSYGIGIRSDGQVIAGSGITEINFTGSGISTTTASSGIATIFIEGQPVYDGVLTLQTSGTGLSGSASFSANQEGSSTFTVTSNATSSNSPSTLVSRDANGSFSAEDITAKTFNGQVNSGIATITTLDSTSGTIDYLNVETINVSGVSTFIGTSYFGNNTLEIYSDGSDSSILNNSGSVSIASSSNSFVQIQNLKFETGVGQTGSSVVVNNIDIDGIATIGFTNLSAASVPTSARVYVSNLNGDDNNDGVTSPVKTIKRASQIASLISNAVTIIVDAGEYVENNPIILYDNVSLVGNDLRGTIIRPLHAGVDIFRVRNSCYLSNFTIKDYVTDNVPQYTWNYAVAFDDIEDTSVDRSGYAGQEVNITNVDYDNVAGIATITTQTDHSFVLNNQVRLAGIAFTCDYDNGSTALLYPESNQSGIVDFPVVDIASPTEFAIKVGVTTVSHFYSGGGTVKVGKCIITQSPYVQNASIISALGGNGVLVDGSKVKTPNISIIPEDSENPAIGDQPEFGKSMVANAFTIVSFGGIGYKTINDGYAQLVSCFQIFCQEGSASESGGYLSITNSATNFGTYSLKSSGYSKNSFTFDRGVIAENSIINELQALKIVGVGRVSQTNFILRFHDSSTGFDKTGRFKSSGFSTSFDSSVGINTTTDIITSSLHGLENKDTVIYTPSSNGVIGGLYNDGEYYVSKIDDNNFKLYDDISLTIPVDLTSTSSGIHTLSRANHEFFVESVHSSSNNYQVLTLDSSNYTFVPGRLVTQSATGASGYVVGLASTSLTVSVESNVDFGLGTIPDHALSPATSTVASFESTTDYYTITVTIDSTDSSNEDIQNISSLIEDYYCYLCRPSIVNSSSHTWEYAGSGNDYNALPQNGGKPNPTFEQYSERGGRVYSSGTNELGDFKVGDAITAFNRTGDIVFNNTVQIGELTSLKFSVGTGPEINEISTDIGLGENEPGGALDSRITTQKAQKTFLNNRLGDFIDKTASTNAVPNAIVTLNASGQINSELIPISLENAYYTVNEENGRTSLVDDIPAISLSSGDLVLENTGITTITYRLLNDRDSQYLILSDNVRNYNFYNGDEIVSTNNVTAVGVVTAPHNVGYGTTGLVKGVVTNVNLTASGSGYSSGTYQNVLLSTVTGTGSSATADVTVNGSGVVSNVDFNFGGKGYQSGDTLRIDSIPISGSNYATLAVSSVETRLYTKITNNVKFSASAQAPHFIEDVDAVGLSTNLQEVYSKSFDAFNDVDVVSDRIIIGASEFSDGDHVIYNASGGSEVSGLSDGNIYYVKKVGISSVELHSSYYLNNVINLTGTGTGTQLLTRVGVNTTNNFIVLSNHGYTVGDSVKVSGSDLPNGLNDGGYYYVGSVVNNGFTLHDLRSDSLASINGITVNPVSLGSTGSGIGTFRKQNVQFNSTVNTSSTNSSNWSVLSSNNIDASNIVSGVISPSRLGTLSATEDTFLSGNSTYQKVVKGVGIGTTEPITITATSYDITTGITTGYGSVNLKLDRVSSTGGGNDYTNLGISRFKKSTFNIGEDGSVSLKSTLQGGDLDASTLEGQQGSYYLDPTNLSSSISVLKGGTGKSTNPSLGSLLVGNGIDYNLTTNPSISGNVTAKTFIGQVNSGIATITTLDVANGTIDYVNSSQIDVTGIVTATTFDGNVTGNVTGNVSGSSGSCTGNAATATTLANARTINGVSFNGSANITITANTSNTLTRGTYLTGSDFNGGAATTWAVDATSANTASKVVARDASGNFSAGTITAALSGNASTATTLQTARTINGVSFNGSANITVEPYIEDDESTNATRYLVFTDNSTAGYKKLNEDSTLTYNPSTNTLTAGTFSGSLSGNATSATSATNATNATNFDVVADNATNATHYLIFTGGATGNQRPNSDTALYYNPSTDTLTAGNFNSTSDINLKKDIEVITNATDLLNQINGVRFTWKNNDNKSVGVIAQEIEKVLPELVTENDGTKTVNYNGLIGVLIEAVKELSARVEELESYK